MPKCSTMETIRSEKAPKKEPTGFVVLTCYWADIPKSESTTECVEFVCGYRVNKKGYRYYVCRKHWDLLNMVLD
jgi:hypothetical protein